MKDIHSMTALPKFISGNPVSEEDIRFAEAVLEISFSPEYRSYLRRFGFASYFSHELTGLLAPKRLDVVNVTTINRNCVPNMNDFYVIEEANIDGIVFWQKATGEVVVTRMDGTPRKVANSLLEYINQTISSSEYE